MITKKDIPFDLLKAIEGIAQSNLDIIQLKKEDNTYYSFAEIDNNSKNCFKIYIDGSKAIGNFDKRNYACLIKPTNATLVANRITQCSLKDLASLFEEWVRLIREINETPSLHDDTFTKYYSDFYFNEFKIVDEDANTSPFSPHQQDLLDIYLDSLSQVVEKSNEKLDPFMKSELISEIQDIKTTLSISTKNQVMKRITKVFGGIYKKSKEFGKQIVEEAKKTLIKKLIELGIDYAPKVLEMFN